MFKNISPISSFDPDLAEAMNAEAQRQEDHVELILLTLRVVAVIVHVLPVRAHWETRGAREDRATVLKAGAL